MSDSTTPDPLVEAVSAVAGLRYRPRPGSVGDMLAAIRRDRGDCDLPGLASFAAAALHAEGLWWVLALDADPDALADYEAAFVLASWCRWLDREPVFRGVRRG